VVYNADWLCFITFLLFLRPSGSVYALFADNFRAGKKTTNSVWRWRLISCPPLRLCARMLMARDELFPSYLDTARGTSSIHLAAATPYNIIRALLNIKNVTLKWLIHLRCKHECVPEVSFLICEQGCGGADGGKGWLRWQLSRDREERQPPLRYPKKGIRPFTPLKLYKPTCLPRQYSTAEVIGFQDSDRREWRGKTIKNKKRILSTETLVFFSLFNCIIYPYREIPSCTYHKLITCSFNRFHSYLGLLYLSAELVPSKFPGFFFSLYPVDRLRI